MDQCATGRTDAASPDRGRRCPTLSDMRHIASFLIGVAMTIVVGYGFVYRPLPMADGASDLADAGRQLPSHSAFRVTARTRS